MNSLVVKGEIGDDCLEFEFSDGLLKTFGGGCLDFFASHGKFGLYECHGGSNQQFSYDAEERSFHHDATGKTLVEVTTDGGEDKKENEKEDKEKEKEKDKKPLRCAGWCKTHSSSWDEKCTYKACNGCAVCGENEKEDSKQGDEEEEKDKNGEKDNGKEEKEGKDKSKHCD